MGGGPARTGPALLVREIRARPIGRTVGVSLWDGIHRMWVTMAHDGQVITKVRGRSLDYPWTTCPGAAARLDDFIGQAVGGAARPASDQGLHCTHLLDLARLAAAQIVRGVSVRYRIEVRRVADRPADRLEASIARDGQVVVAWVISDYVVRDPPLFAGHDFNGRARLPASCSDDPLLVEAVMMLRRAVKMFRGRDRAEKATHYVHPADRAWMAGLCHSFQPGVAAHAERVPGHGD